MMHLKKPATNAQKVVAQKESHIQKMRLSIATLNRKNSIPSEDPEQRINNVAIAGLPLNLNRQCVL